MDDLSHHGIGELSDVIRPLDSLEHLFWLSDQNRPLHFAVTAQVSGETSVSEWREALARTNSVSMWPLITARPTLQTGSLSRAPTGSK